jgi:sugar phosphate isomerase/epimerase
MAKLGVITDGISRDFEHALQVMTDANLEYAELQFLWEKEVGDLDDDEMARATDLLNKYGAKVSCISRHNFAGMGVGDVEVGDVNHQKHMDSTKSCIDMAKALDCDLVRIMSFRKEMILFGYNGAEKWNANTTAWNKLKELLTPVVKMAEDEDIMLVVETGNNAMITSCVLGHKLIDELNTKHLKILWDPANSLYCNEPAYPEGYDALRNGYLGHLHIKDSNVDIPMASVEQTAVGDGAMAAYFEDIARSLKEDQYDGVVSIESVYHPGNDSYEDGFASSIDRFKQIFGNT